MRAPDRTNGFQRVEFAVAVNDVELRCTSFGAGPTVVLLHAGGEQRRVWRPVAERLAACGFRAIAVDQRGHGETGGAVGKSLDDYADDLRGLLAWLDVPLVLVGASLGGLAALLAVTDPTTTAQVTGVVLVDVKPDPDPTRSRQFLQAIESDRAHSPGPLWEWDLVDDILSRSPQLRAAAASLAIPVTLVRGGASPVLRPADVEDFLAFVPHATIREVHGAGHLIARDRPDDLADLLLEHLGRGQGQEAPKLRDMLGSRKAR